MLKYTQFADVTARAAGMEVVEGNFGDFYQRLLELGKAPLAKEASPLVKFATFTGDENPNRCARTNEFMVQVYGVEGDYDAEKVSPEAAAEMLRAYGVHAIVATTHSHTPEKPRWRVFAPLSAPVVPEERDRLVAQLNGILGGILGGESFTRSQSFYIGAAPGSEYKVIGCEGMCLDMLDPDDLPAPMGKAAAEKRRRLAVAGGTTAVEGTLKALLEGEDLHENAMLLIARQVQLGLSDDLIWGLFDQVYEQLCNVRGKARVDALYEGFPEQRGELYRFIRGAREKGYGDSKPELTEPERAQRDQRQREKAQKVGSGAADVVPLEPLQDLAQMLKRFTLIKSGDLIHDALNPRALLPLNSWRTAMAASMTLGAKDKLHPTTKMWEQSQERRTVYGLTFEAGGEMQVVDFAGHTCMNTWSGWRLPDVEPGDPALFVEHVQFLFEDMAEPFLDWCAHMLQHPGELPSTAWLHISHVQGLGRNLLSSMLAYVARGYCATGIDMGKLLDSTFNGELSGKVLGVVDEIREGGGNSYRQQEKLKSMITESHRKINAKNRAPYWEKNAMRWLVFSNHRSAIPLQQEDRRWNVAVSTSLPRSEGYYNRLGQALEDEHFIRGVAEFLLSRDIRGYNAQGRAKMTDMKAQLVEGMSAPELLALRELHDTFPHRLISAKALRKLADVDDEVSGRAFMLIAEDAGWVSIGRHPVETGKTVKHPVMARAMDAKEWVQKPASVLKLSMHPKDNGTGLTILN